MSPAATADQAAHARTMAEMHCVIRYISGPTTAMPKNEAREWIPDQASTAAVVTRAVIVLSLPVRSISSPPEGDINGATIHPSYMTWWDARSAGIGRE